MPKSTTQGKLPHSSNDEYEDQTTAPVCQWRKMYANLIICFIYSIRYFFAAFLHHHVFVFYFWLAFNTQSKNDSDDKKNIWWRKMREFEQKNETVVNFEMGVWFIRKNDNKSIYEGKDAKIIFFRESITD
jgi:hypothetical protein